MHPHMRFQKATTPNDLLEPKKNVHKCFGASNLQPPIEKHLRTEKSITRWTFGSAQWNSH